MRLIPPSANEVWLEACLKLLWCLQLCGGLPKWGRIHEILLKLRVRGEAWLWKSAEKQKIHRLKKEEPISALSKIFYRLGITAVEDDLEWGKDDVYSQKEMRAGARREEKTWAQDGGWLSDGWESSWKIAQTKLLCLSPVQEEFGAWRKQMEGNRGFGGIWPWAWAKQVLVRSAVVRRAFLRL